MKKAFSIEQILTVTTGIALYDMGGIYEILNFMTGEELSTHQLPRARKASALDLLRQHPQLTDFDASGVNPENAEGFILGIRSRFGMALRIEPLPSGNYEPMHPVEEMQNMKPDGKIIVVDRSKK